MFSVMKFSRKERIMTPKKVRKQFFAHAGSLKMIGYETRFEGMMATVKRRTRA